MIWILLGCSPAPPTGAVHDTAAPPAPAILPAAPYPDSPLAVSWDLEPESCTWMAGELALGEGCTAWGDQLGLEPGESLSVLVADAAGREARSEPVQVAAPPELLVTETMSGAVAVVDGGELVVSAEVELEGSFPMPVAVLPSGGGAWVTAHVGQGLARLEPDPWRLEGWWDLGTQVYWLAPDPAGGRLLVADQGRARLLSVPEDDPAAFQGIELPDGPVSVRVSGDLAWVACRPGGSPTGRRADPPEQAGGWLARVDPATGELESVALGEQPYWAEPSPDGSLVAVADQSGQAVLLVDAATMELVESWPVPGGPTGIAWSADGAALYAALYTEGLVVELDAATGQELARWEAGRGAVGVFPRSDGRWLYVPVLHEDRVLAIDTRDGSTRAIEGVSGPRDVEELGQAASVAATRAATFQR